MSGRFGWRSCPALWGCGDWLAVGGVAATGYAGADQDVFDPVGAEAAGVSDVVVEGHGRELLCGGGPLPVRQGPLDVGLDGGPVDVGDAGADDVGQVGEPPVGVAAVAVDEFL